MEALIFNLLAPIGMTIMLLILLVGFVLTAVLPAALLTYLWVKYVSNKGDML